MRLHEDPYWHTLLHYKPYFSGYRSLIDDPRFFLAAGGKTDPKAELDATIQAFFEPQDEGDKSAACRFVARFEWICEKLTLDRKALPVSECRSFEDFMDTVKPETVALVFPSAHLNSPASMFGHTLLTIDTYNKSRILAYSVNYTAVTSETFGPLFAVKGIFGLYPGYFSIQPYYTKLQEYSDVEHRDIWEYQLNLTQPEIRRMMLNIREKEGISSDYFFFDENCSYDLMFLLEAARPGARLTDSVHGWLIPLDSIRMIDEQGFITGVQYRPSRTTKIKYLASRLSEKSQDAAFRFASEDPDLDIYEKGEVPDNEKIRTLDLAGEYLQYLYAKKKVPQETYKQRFLKILRERSLLGVSEDDVSSRILTPVAPDKGHESNRLAFGAGVQGGDGFSEIRIRPAYHGLMDCDDGYIEGAQLIFAEAGLRYFPSEGRIMLKDLDVIDIISLTPRDRFFSPISWKIKTGLVSMAWNDDKGHLVYEVNPGGGFAYKNDIAGLVYCMVETDLKVGGVLEHDYSLGAGGSAGVMKTVTTQWKAHLSARGISYGLGDRFNAFQGSLQNNIAFGRNRSVSLDLTRGRTRDFYETEAKVLYNQFF